MWTQYFGTSMETTVSYRNINIEHRMREEGEKGKTIWNTFNTTYPHNRNIRAYIKFPAVLAHFSVCHLEIE